MIIENGILKKCDLTGDVVLPEKIKVIGGVQVESDREGGRFPYSIFYYPFTECAETLTSVVTSKGLVEVGEKAFMHVHSLKTVFLSDGVEKIGLQAFNGCYSLKTVYMPKTIKEIEGLAFAGCSDLVIYYSGTREEFKKIKITLDLNKWHEGETLIKCIDGDLIASEGTSLLDVETREERNARMEAFARKMWEEHPDLMAALADGDYKNH